MLKNNIDNPPIKIGRVAKSPSSWEAELPNSCDQLEKGQDKDPEILAALYEDALKWLAELNGDPPYPLRTLMNVANVADLLRKQYLERAQKLEEGLNRLGLSDKIPEKTQRHIGQLVLAIHNLYHQKAGASPAETIMAQFYRDNLPTQDEEIPPRKQAQESPLTHEAAHKAVEDKLAKAIEGIYRPEK